MRCLSPIRLPQKIDGHYRGLSMMVACGHCLHCSINRQMSWCLRIILESSTRNSDGTPRHNASSFLTLTYEDNRRPHDLKYEHIQSFLRDSRKSLGARSVRFFCVGEYGERTEREHWHLILFGMAFPKTAHFRIAQWPHGACFAGTVTTASAAYVARYSLKSGPKGGQFVMQCSRRPGIGVERCEEIARHFAKQAPVVEQMPTWWCVGPKTYPLDKTMREKFRAAYLAAGGRILKERSPLELDFDAEAYAIIGDPVGQKKGAYRLQKFRTEALRGSF